MVFLDSGEACRAELKKAVGGLKVFFADHADRGEEQIEQSIPQVPKHKITLSRTNFGVKCVIE